MDAVEQVLRQPFVAHRSVKALHVGVLQSPYRDGTTHVIFEPVDFLARLAALMPRPKVNLTRFHGVFAPHHRLRAQIVPSKADPHDIVPVAAQGGGGGSRAVRMGWAQRLKRVFGIEVERCERCGGALKIIASIEAPAVTAKILEHLQEKGESLRAPYARGPPLGL